MTTSNSSGTPSTPGTSSTSSTSGIVRASSVMAAGTLASRITGFVAKVVLLAFLGAWVVSDSYNLANTLPNIVFELLVGGVLASVAIPLLSRAAKDPDGGARYTQQLMTMAIVALLIATAAAMACAPLLIRAYQWSSSSAEPGMASYDMATQFAYLLLPQIFFYGLAALFGAILNTKERFAGPAWAPVANNLVVIGVGIVLFTTSGSITDPDHGLADLSRGQFLLLGGGTTLGIVLQAAILLPAVRRTGFRFRWRWGVDSRMVEAGRLMGWAIAYALVSQIGYLVTVNVAYAGGDSLHQHGLYTLYWFGSMLFQLPYGLLGVSLLTAIMPRMSRHAADGDMGAVKHDMSLANRLSSVALLPVTAAMIALAVPLATVTAQYGRVTTDDARILAFTLAAFAIGLLPLAITLVQMRVFYAMKDGRTPAIINAIMVAVRIPLLIGCLALPVEWVVPGLAAAMSASYIVGVAVGEVWLRMRFGRMGFGATLSTIARTALASAVAGLAAWWVTDAVLPVDMTSFGGAVASLATGGLVGLVLVAVGLHVLRVDEARALWRRIAGRLHHRAAERGTLVEVNATSGAPTMGTPERTQGQVSVTDPHLQTVFAPGVMVGERYRLVVVLAVDSGGSEFWQARDTVLPRDMAITLLPGVEHTAATVTRTLRVGRLEHPGLPSILDMGSVTARSGTSAAYIAGPWSDGATLTELLSGGSLDPTVAAALTAKVTDAVELVHRHGLSLGELSPSLVRVNADGQARLSHVIARADSSTDDDVRAAGALLYLMLTATWPFPDSSPAPSLPLAPRSDDHEVPAYRTNPVVPQGLSTLCERALHPEGRQGIHAIGAMTALLSPQDARSAHHGPDGGPGRDGRHGAADGPARQDPTAVDPTPRRSRASARGARASGSAATPTFRSGASTRDAGVVRGAPPPALVRERRVKLGIAGAMMTILTVLIVIVAAAVIKQFLTGIAEPIKQSDSQVLIDTTVPTTTRTVGPTTTSPSGDDTTGTSETGAPSTTEAPPKAVPIPVAGATVYDPQGTPPADNVSLVDRAFDGDQGTPWPTWVYKQQFGKAQGGLKDGVGLLLSFKDAVTPSSVTVSTGTPGTTVEIRSADSAKPKLSSTKVLGSAELDDDPVSITLSDAPKSQYLLVWITKLAPYQGTSASNQGQFQSNITEISVSGS